MKDTKLYNDTLELPKTNFEMRANLPEKELQTIKFWDEINLWQLLRNNAQGKEKFVLHDGPPYANGPIHMGTAANKILKDIINRTMQMEGYDSVFVPGWDCHGLPIEWQIEKEYRKKGLNKDEVNIRDFRSECRDFAKKWISEQKKSFIRLFVLADWKKPYLTMDYKSEATILREFTKFFLDGSLYRGSKPVMWSPVEKTALAEAEIEYKNIVSKSIYVSFEIIESDNKELINTNVVIWTTTPWTIPGNKAVAFGFDITYVLFKVQYIEENNNNINKKYIVAKRLLENLLNSWNIKKFTIIKEFKGETLERSISLHPLNKKGYDYKVPLIAGDFVEDNEGTGFVHIAPSYGEDDFNLAQKYDIDIKDIIDDSGLYIKGTPLFEGTHVFKADDSVIKHLQSQESLVGIREYTHSYPHSWRSKKPVIYRTTAQWFISMDKNNLRDKALRGIENTNWIPSLSKNRIKKMVNDRPDWCVSRQRAWGVPLTIFINKKTGEPLRDKNIMEKIIFDVEENGSDVWLSSDVTKYLGEDRDAQDFEIIRDILDVWFDSGSTHAFVLENNLKWPADLYLEGTDQHRGFFQSSLLASCGTRGKPPYKSVLTHGFVLDGNGRKMSKSLGNVIKPEDILKKSGADILRLWIATTDYTEDMRIGDEILSNLNDYYRKIRNCFRFILGNIGNTEKKDCLVFKDLTEIDKYILAKITELDKLRKVAIKSHTYHNFYKALFEFCSVDLSSFYFDISKDTLYCDSKRSLQRNSICTVLYYLYDILTSWFAPVLSHTMEETWKEYKTENLQSVHLKLTASIPKEWENNDLLKKWEKIRQVRKIINTAIESTRSKKIIGSSLETEAYMYLNDASLNNIIKSINMKKISIISKFVLLDNNENTVTDYVHQNNNESEGYNIYIKKTKYIKCPRCWQFAEEINTDGELCTRCKETLRLRKDA